MKIEFKLFTFFIRYGLILPKKQQLITSAAPVKTLSVFNDSNSDEESPNDWMQRTLEVCVLRSAECFTNIIFCFLILE